MQIASSYSKFTHPIRDFLNYPCPISALPVELLQEIFAFSMTARVMPRIRSTIPDEELEPPTFQITAMVITWVCSHWRYLALSMPELWGTMTINKPKNFCVELVKVYLSRSGCSTPLNLFLHQDFVEYYVQRDGLMLTLPEHHATVEILKLWVPQAHRWRLISLHLRCTPITYELPTIPPGALSCLQEADIDVFEPSLPSYLYDKDNVILKSLWQNIFQSPSLQIAHWHNFRGKRPDAPFPQLSEFGPFSPTVDELLSLLPSCQRLRRIEVCVTSRIPQVYPPPSVFSIVLPLLEDLFISSPRILDYISSPRLRTLKVSDDRKPPFADSQSLERFLRRSCCALQTLRLYQRRTDDEASLLRYILPAIKYLTSLEALQIDGLTLSENTISLFNPRVVNDGVSVPFPYLLNLQLHTIIAGDGIISSMLESRAAVGVPLRTFICDVSPGPVNTIGHPKDEAILLRLKQQGLQLSWFACFEEVDTF